MNTSPGSDSDPSSAPEQPPAPQPRAINFATEWLDEDGCVCPKNVDYATQCPKGHALVPLDGGGGAQAQEASGADVMCRVCHASTPRQHACQWLAAAGATPCAQRARVRSTARVQRILGARISRWRYGARKPHRCSAVAAHAAELRRA
jgi:hypothetical protein